MIIVCQSGIKAFFNRKKKEKLNITELTENHAGQVEKLHMFYTQTQTVSLTLSFLISLPHNVTFPKRYYQSAIIPKLQYHQGILKRNWTKDRLAY